MANPDNSEMIEAQSPEKKEFIRKSIEFWNPGKTQFWQDVGVDLVIDRRQDYFLYDMDGRRLIDVHLNGGTYNIGHRHPELVEVLNRGTQRFDMGNHHFPALGRTALAEIDRAGELPLHRPDLDVELAAIASVDDLELLAARHHGRQDLRIEQRIPHLLHRRVEEIVACELHLPDPQLVGASRRHGSLSTRDAREVLRQILQGLQVVHRQEVVDVCERDRHAAGARLVAGAAQERIQPDDPMAALPQAPAYRVRGILPDALDSTTSRLRTLCPGARLGTCLRHARNKLPAKRTALASPVRQA